MTIMPTESAVRAIAFTSLDEDLQRHDNVVDESQDVRRFLLNKVTDLINATDFTKKPEGLADASGRLSAVNTALALVKDAEAAEFKRASLKLKKKDTDTAQSMAEIVTEMLARSPIERMTTTFKDESDRMMVDLESEIDGSDDPIKDTELREDPYHLG
jgi:hypothetical protein